MIKKIHIAIIIVTVLAIAVPPIDFVQDVRAYDLTTGKFYLWITTDPHANVTGDQYDVLQDAEIYFPEWDICLVLGDIAHTSLTGQFDDWRNTQNTSNRDLEEFYLLSGNHDQNWNAWNTKIDVTGSHPETSFINNSKRPFQITNASQTCYEIQIKNSTITTNLVILMMGADVNDTDNGASSMLYPYYDWWRKRIENHTNDIVITCTHHQLYYAGLSYYGSLVRTKFVREHDSDGFFPTNYTKYMNVTEGHEKACDIWTFGHMHGVDTGTAFINASDTNYNGYELNCTFFFSSSIYADSQGGIFSGDPEAHTFLLTFSNNSDTVQMGDFDHTHDLWDSGYIGNKTLYLHHPFILQETSSESNQTNNKMQFIEIGGGTNGTVVTSSTPTFNWTNISQTQGYWYDVISYRLRIANDSNFTDIVVDLSNITKKNTYLSSYIVDNSTTISFTLPAKYALEKSKTYYCDVRSQYIPGWTV